MEVPEIVLFGLMEGSTSGPLSNLPKRYAVVSLRNEIIIIK
jgi:hypothetical protein